VGLIVVVVVVVEDWSQSSRSSLDVRAAHEKAKAAGERLQVL
jgi:hypothetical protein